MVGRLKRGAVLTLGSALCLFLMASAASARPFAGSGPAASAGPGASRTLNIYGFGPGDDVANGRAAFAEGRLGSDVAVDNPRGAFNDQAFLAMLASGNVPDVVYMSRRLVGTYAAKRALLPLANCIRSQRIDVNQYRRAALTEVRYRGQTYAMPEFTNQITLIVDDDVVRDSGVNINNLSTRNWAQLRAMSRRMMRSDGSRLTRI